MSCHVGIEPIVFWAVLVIYYLNQDNESSSLALEILEIASVMFF